MSQEENIAPSTENLTFRQKPDFVVLNEMKPRGWHYFYQRISNGELDRFGDPKVYEPFACTEQEATDIEKRVDTIRFRQVGASDGMTYFKYMKDHIKPGVPIPREEAEKIQRDALQAELDVAKGHYRKPRGDHFTYAGASQGVQNPEELLARFAK